MESVEAFGFHRVNQPPPPPVNNIYRVAFLGNLENQRLVNMFYYRDDKPLNTVTRPLFQELFSILQTPTKLMQVFLESISADYTFAGIVVDSPTQPTVVGFGGAVTGFGGAGTGHLPMQMCATIARESDWRGQCGRGRISVPGVPPSAVTETTITTTAGWDNLLLEMRTPILSASTTFTPVIWSKGIKGGRPAGSADVVRTFLRKTLGTCRSRKPGVGL